MGSSPGPCLGRPSLRSDGGGGGSGTAAPVSGRDGGERSPDARGEGRCCSERSSRSFQSGSDTLLSVSWGHCLTRWPGSFGEAAGRGLASRFGDRSPPRGCPAAGPTARCQFSVAKVAC